MGLIHFVFFWGFDLSFITSMWAVGWTVGYSFEDTFSYLLQNNDTIRMMYIIWLATYIIKTYVFIVLTNVYDFQIDKNEYPDLTTDFGLSKVIKSVSNFYTFNELVKPIGLICIPIFNMTTEYQLHYTFATLAFLSNILTCWCLFVRRLFIYSFHKKASVNSSHMLSTVCAKYYHCTLPKIIAINFIWLILGLVFVGGFVDGSRGSFEFFLCIWIITDCLFRIPEIYQDPNGHNKHVVFYS